MFFDSAKRQTCEVKPNLTNTPLHALTTLNDMTLRRSGAASSRRRMLESKTIRRCCGSPGVRAC